jgi:DNA-binding MarR family transcriptional regulator
MAGAADRTLEQAMAAVAGRALGGGAARTEAPEADSPDFQRYFHGIAKAHEIIRKVFRIVDERARAAGLEPLEHKLFIQIFGAWETQLRITELAARLDIPPALASRLVKGLEVRGLVVRTPAAEDRRMIRVGTTDAARTLLGDIDRGVRRQVDYFQAGLSDDDRAAALRVFAFYLGARSPED